MEPENLKPGYVRDDGAMTASDVDRNKWRFAFPERL